MRTTSAVTRTFAALGCAGLLMAVPGVALAGPGAPGVDSAGEVVYQPAVGPTVLGEETPGGQGGVAGEETPTVSPATDVTPVVPGSDGGGVESLPFTGLALAGVLGVGVALLLLGGGLRRVSRQHA